MIASALVLFLLPAVVTTTAGATPIDEAALHFLLKSLSDHARGDIVRGRHYLPATVFSDGDVARLIAVSREYAQSKRSARRRPAPGQPVYPLSPIDGDVSRYLKDRLGPALYAKTLEFCRQTIEPRIRVTSAPIR